MGFSIPLRPKRVRWEIAQTVDESEKTERLRTLSELSLREYARLWFFAESVIPPSRALRILIPANRTGTFLQAGCERGVLSRAFFEEHHGGIVASCIGLDGLSVGRTL